MPPRETRSRHYGSTPVGDGERELLPKTHQYRSAHDGDRVIGRPWHLYLYSPTSEHARVPLPYGETFQFTLHTYRSDVSSTCSGKKPKESIVVSVRLTASESYRLEELCDDTGRSMSQLVRDAIAVYPGTDKSDSNVFGVTLLIPKGSLSPSAQGDHQPILLFHDVRFNRLEPG